jgi:hypothetical protein
MDTQQVVFSTIIAGTEGPDYLSELKSRAKEIRRHPGIMPSKVESAYVPSGIAPPGSIVRVILCAILGIPLGYLAAAVWRIIILLLSLLPRTWPSSLWFVNLITLAMILALPFVPAAVIGWMTGVGARWCKSRKPSQVGRVAMAVTFIGNVLPILVLVGMVMADASFVQQIASGQISLWGVLIGVGLIAVFAVISLAVARSRARGMVKGQKFCEECQEYMKSKRFSTFPLDKTAQAALHLLDWNLADLAQIPKIGDYAENRCGMDLWTCGCHQTNYLELTTHGKIGGKKYNNRLVFSTCLNPEHVTLLGSTLGVNPYIN